MRLLLAAAALLLGAGAAEAAPNFVVIMTDDQSENMTGYMPNATRLVGDEGTKFDLAFVTDPICCPSRASFLTGQHPTNHGVKANIRNDLYGMEYFDDRETLSVWLKRGGYETGIIGKYLNGYNERFPASYIPPGWDTWFVAREGFHGQFDFKISDQGVERTIEDYGADVMSGRAEEFIRESGSKPFFLFMSYAAPHVPSTPAPRHAGLFPGLKSPKGPAYCEEDIGDKPWMLVEVDCTDEQKRAIDTRWRKGILSLQAVDDGVERIVNALRNKGKLDKTYIIFTSDNGYHWGDHRMFPGKDLPYETDLGVPLMVRGPNVPERFDERSFFLNIDLAPTILGLANLPIPAMVDGSNRENILRGGEPIGPRQSFAFMRWIGQDFDAKRHRDMYGVRTKNWKYINWGEGQFEELYDLREDPHELESLHSAPGTPIVELRALALAYRTCKGEACRVLERAPAP
jgi:N-acetylglucosamine-6-sulfatase